MWLTIIVWLVSYLLSYSKTKDAGKSALIATGAAAAAYYTVEPTNPDAVWGDASRNFFGMDPVDPTTVPTSGQKSATGANLPGAASALDLGSTAIKTTGDVLKSWGPAGTVGVVAGTKAVGSMSGNTLIWVAAAIGLLLLAR